MQRRSTNTNSIPTDPEGSCDCSLYTEQPPQPSCPHPLLGTQGPQLELQAVPAVQVHPLASTFSS